MADKKSILIVDDTPSNIKILNDMLKNEYKIIAATSGEKALDIVSKKNPPDLILLDIMMPEMDGYEVYDRLKDDDQTKDIPVIFVTASGAAEDNKKAEEKSVDVVAKPIELYDLLKKVKKYI